MMRNATLAFLIVLVAAVSGWGARTSQPTQFDSNQPIRITSDRLSADDTARQMTFLGHVVAARAMSPSTPTT